MAEQEQQEISIEDLELSLEVYEIESEEKLRKLEKLFAEKGAVDPSKMFYEQRSALQIKFQNIVSDLTEFLINQQIASTDKLRQTFLRLLQNPLIFLFKVSRFEIFNLRLNAFDIELQPIQAILELGDSIIRNIDKQQVLRGQGKQARNGADYTTYQQFLQEAQAKLIQDQIFLLYSYLRKGANLIRKKFQDKVRVVELYGKIQEKLLKTCVDNSDTKTLKELAVLNYQLYLLENTFDVLCFYLKVPFRAEFSDSFKELQALGVKAKQSSNYDLFILIFLRYWKEIMGKLQAEGIQATYSSYIENVLTSILQLWGCRLCYFQQFFEIFQKLLNLHPKKHQAIQLCLKHSPKFEKDDIVLLRTHFKHDLLQKHSQLLSLLRVKTMEDINGSLNGLYHRILYNLDYSLFGRQQIIVMLTTLNGNSSLSEFFGVAERAFKEWNHTIDFTYPHKYIETQYKLPKLQQSKILQSVRLFNNICYLQEKQFKDFQPLIKSGTIHKALVDLASFFFNNEEASKLLIENEPIKVLLTNSLKFLRRTSQVSSDWSALCLNFTSRLSILSEEYVKSIIASIIEITNQYYESFTIKSIVEVYGNLIKCEKQLKINQSKIIPSLTNIFMRGVYHKNQQVKLFKFFDSSITNNTLLTQNQQNFLRKYAILNVDIIEPKQNGCFILSDLQVITNPVQFDKVMDNYYFTLDNNSKRYIHYLAYQWYSLVTNKQENNALILLSFMKNLLSECPIAIPLLSTTRIYLSNNTTKRFIEVLVDSLTKESYDLLKLILECRCIRYKNGRDYVKEELVPLVLKAAIKAVNEDSTNVIYLQLLSISLKNSRSTDIKTDLIQKAIDVLNYQIVESKDPQRIYRLSNAKNQLLMKFFQKKQLQMRKKGLQTAYSQLVLSETRTKIAPIQIQQINKAGKKTALSQQIMITPFAISQQFNIQQSKLEKTSSFESNIVSPSIELSAIRASIPTKPNLVGNVSQKVTQQVKNIDLTNLKYNIQCHLGSQVKQFCLKEGYRLITKRNQVQQVSEGNDQNITLVQYYLKEFQSSQITSEVVLQYIGSLIEGKVQYSSIFVNFSNLQKLFFGLILIFKAATGKNAVTLKSESIVDKILSISDDKKLQIAKKIMQIFSKIGYHNIWAESYNSLSSLGYYKQLKQKAAYKQQSAQQSFFSWILKICLEKEQLRDDLNTFLGSIFSTRPKDQNSLMYRVTIDRALLNLIMKSLSIQNLSHLSLFFHSNFNNLRLYTDQLHEGLKALNMASKNRAYNQYIQLSSDIEDDQFFFPLKLFKENFSFFITIETEGYKSKKSQEEKLGRERVLKVLRNGLTEQALRTQIEKVIEQFEQQLEKLQYNIANRVKSFYLATKLRDFSYQNSLTVCLLHQILTEKKVQSPQILKKIKQIEIFSLLNQINNDLVRFGQNQIDDFLQNDRSKAQKEVTVASTKRYSHSISKIYEKCQLQFDEVFQRCIDVLRVFFVSSEGKTWLTELNVYPPFLSKSFLGSQKAADILRNIKSKASIAKISEVTLQADQSSFSNLLKSLRQIEKVILLQKDHVKIQFNNQVYTLSQFLVPFKAYLIQSQTLSKSKDGYLLFNKYKTSQKTLEQIQILGLIVGYSVFNGIELDLPLHSSILNAANFGICDLDDLIDIDFKVWQDLRNVISTSQSKDLNLNFSYIFESLETLKPDRVELVDKGSSKKVNNLNRQQYADSVCCYLLFKIVEKQMNRFLEAVIYSCPKLLLSSLPIQQFLKLFLNKIPNYMNQILRRLMKRRALILPPSVLVKQKRYQNSFDYQTIQWFNEIIESQPKIREKLWPLQQNIFLCTWMGQGVDISVDRKTLVIGRLNSREELSQVLKKFA